MLRAILAVVLACAVWAPPAAAGVVIRDAVGDAVGGAPDLASVAVERQADELVFTVGFAGGARFGVDEAEGYTDMLVVALDVDDGFACATTADCADIDYALGLHGADAARVSVWTARTRRSVETGRAALAGRTLTLRVTAAAVGDPERFNVAVAVGREYVQGAESRPAYDLAPDEGAGSWSAGDGGTLPYVPAAAAGAALLVAAAVAYALRRHRGGHARPAY